DGGKDDDEERPKVIDEVRLDGRREAEREKKAEMVSEKPVDAEQEDRGPEPAHADAPRAGRRAEKQRRAHEEKWRHVPKTNADCQMATTCGATGQCTAKDGKCVVATNDDCAKGTACKASGFCTAKDGICVVGSDADCGQSELCKNMHKCAAKGSACIDASFS